MTLQLALQGGPAPFFDGLAGLHPGKPGQLAAEGQHGLIDGDDRRVGIPDGIERGAAVL